MHVMVKNQASPEMWQGFLIFSFCYYAEVVGGKFSR